MQSAASTFDHAATDYNQQLQQGLSLSGESAEYFVEGRVTALAGLLQKTLRRCTADRVLDFGCGVGNAAHSLVARMRAQELVGLDCSAESVELARRRFRDNCYQFLVDGDELHESSFDLAHTSGVFHHILPEERDGHLSSIYKWLKPGGVFAFFENNPWNPGTRWVMSRIPFDRDAICLSIAESQRRLRKAGFEILATRSMFYFPNALRAFRPLERGLQYLPLGAQYLVLCRRPKASRSSES